MTRMKRSSHASPAPAFVGLVVAIVLAAFLALWVAGAQATRNVTSTTVATIASGRFTATIPEPAFLRYPRDDRGHVAYEIGALKVHRPGNLPVYVIGGSNVREGIQTPAALQTAIERCTGVATTVVNLGATALNLAGTMAEIDNLPRGRGVVVISINQSAFAYARGDVGRQAGGDPLLIESPAVRQLASSLEPGHTPPPSIAGALHAYVAAWRNDNAAALKAGREPWNVYTPHKCNVRRVSDAAKRAEVRSWLTHAGKTGGAFFANDPFWCKVLRDAVTLARSRGFSVVISEGSLDRSVVGHAFDRYRRVYMPQCKSIARAAGARYVDPNATAGLTDRDYYDVDHLLLCGRSRWTAALAKLIAPAVRQAAKARPSPTSSSSPSPSGSLTASPTESGSPGPSPSSSDSAAPTAFCELLPNGLLPSPAAGR